MSSRILTALCGAVLACLMSLSAAADGGLTDAGIRKNQALGRVIVSPDGKFFLYEWVRPYSWIPQTEWLHPSAAKRGQTWLYKVDLTYGDENVASRYVFHPGAGATYYLGSLSPDSTMVSFYELDHDDSTIKAGVWSFAHEQLAFFDAAPSGSRLEQGPIWVENDVIAYPTASGWVSGKAPINKRTVGPIVPPDWDDTIKTAQCAGCKSQKNRGAAAGVYRGPEVALGQKRAPTNVGTANTGPDAHLGPDARLLARSQNGDLSIYMRDTPEMLALIYQKGADVPVTVFESERVLQPRAASRSAHE